MTVPDAMFDRYKVACKSVYEIPKDSETDEPLFTDTEWVLEDVKKIIKQRIATLESKARAKANAATPITENVTFS